MSSAVPAPVGPGLVQTVLIRHDRGRHLTAAILAVAAQHLADRRVRSEQSGHLAASVRMYEPHEAWEDTVIYPALRAATPQRTLELLAERFPDPENIQYGDARWTRCCNV